jgi:hypothetical protein
MFQILKCRGDQDLGLCTFEVLAQTNLLRNGETEEKNVIAKSETNRDSPTEKLEIALRVNQSIYKHDFSKYYYCTRVPFIT